MFSQVEGVLPPARALNSRQIDFLLQAQAASSAAKDWAEALNHFTCRGVQALSVRDLCHALHITQGVGRVQIKAIRGLTRWISSSSGSPAGGAEMNCSCDSLWMSLRGGWPKPGETWALVLVRLANEEYRLDCDQRT